MARHAYLSLWFSTLVTPKSTLIPPFFCLWFLPWASHSKSRAVPKHSSPAHQCLVPQSSNPFQSVRQSSQPLLWLIMMGVAPGPWGWQLSWAALGGAGARAPFLRVHNFGSPTCHCASLLLYVCGDEPFLGWSLSCDGPGNSWVRVLLYISSYL